MLYEILYKMLYKREIYKLCNNHHDNEIKIKDLRLHESDSEILRY